MCCLHIGAYRIVYSFVVNKEVITRRWLDILFPVLLVYGCAGSTCSLIFISLSRCISSCGERSYSDEKMPNMYLSHECVRAKQRRDSDIVSTIDSKHRHVANNFILYL